MNQCLTFAGSAAAMPARVASNRPMAHSAITGTPVGQRLHAVFGKPIVSSKAMLASTRKGGALQVVAAIKNGATLDRPLRVAVVGGGPSGACAAETLAKGGIETYLFERKLDNCKVNLCHLGGIL
jgi:geranylgeranyl diphosphate/geranylgeranyl-bacteriochlorophyllide a reductase